MTEQIGQVALEETPHSYLGVSEPGWFVEKKYSEETAREIDLSVKAAIERALHQAGAILKENRAVLERMAAALLEKETLTEVEIQDLLRQKDPARSQSPVAPPDTFPPAPAQAAFAATDTAKI
jgi:cell division protease FtsH